MRRRNLMRNRKLRIILCVFLCVILSGALQMSSMTLAALSDSGTDPVPGPGPGDRIRPAAWGGAIDIQSLPLGTVKFSTIGNYDYYYVNQAPTSAANRGDIPFVGIYPARRLRNGTNTGDSVIEDNGRKVYQHRNASSSSGYVAGDILVGLETRNTANLSGKTLVMYSRIRPVSGSFALVFRDGASEARIAPVSSPSGLSSLSCLRRGSSSASRSFSMPLGLTNEKLTASK